MENDHPRNKGGWSQALAQSTPGCGHSEEVEVMRWWGGCAGVIELRGATKGVCLTFSLSV